MPLLTLPWGHAAGHLGHRPADESIAEGPMALDVGPDGRIAVLDQVHARVQVWRDGQLPEVLGLPSNAFQDLAFGPDGRLWAMRRHGQPEIIAVGAVPPLVVALAHPRLGEPAAATALLVGRDGVWIERVHQDVLHLSDAQAGTPADPQALLGRFGAGQLLVTATLRPPTDAWVVAWTTDGAVAWQAQAQVRDATNNLLPILALREWAPTADGGAWLVIETAEGAERRHQALRWAAGGQLAQTVDLPLPTGPDEQFRPYRVGPDDALYALVADTDAARVWRFAP